MALRSTQAETRRKIRTFLRGITVLMANLDLMNPFRSGRFAFQLASHKLLRFCAPFLLLAGLTTSGLLSDNPVYALFFWLQAGFYLIGTVGGVAQPLQQYRPVRVAYYFTMAQWAMLVAFGRYALGHQQVTWEPSKRHGVVASDQSGLTLERLAVDRKD